MFFWNNSATSTLFVVLFPIWISSNFLLHFLKIRKYTFFRIKKHKLRKPRMTIAASYFLYPPHHFAVATFLFSQRLLSLPLYLSFVTERSYKIILYALFIRSCSLFCSIWIYISLYFLPILWQIYFFIFVCSVFFVCSVLNSMSSL